VSSLGILGGNFSPPHLGHLALARAAREELGLQRVLLMPLHTPAHRAAEEDPGPEHRLAMCRLAAAEETGIEASDLEIERGGPSYTADTLNEIHASDPDAELTFIVGADTALTLPGWRSPERVLGLARLAVAGRPGSDGARILDVLEGIPMDPAAGLPHEHPEVVMLAMAPLSASSSLARERIAAGGETAGLLPAAVAGYIAEHGLYRGER
jgi:nicotinate-nucleotide adenylyltransferase